MVCTSSCPPFLFLPSQSSALQIEDLRGNDEVTLTRKFGDEKCVSNIVLCFQAAKIQISIRLVFSVADLVVEDEFEDRENESEEDEANYMHPTRASLSITKVGHLRSLRLII